MKRKRVELVYTVTSSGKTIYTDPKIRLQKKLQQGTITEEELRVYVELTHVEQKQMPRILQQKLTIKVFGRLIEVTEEQYNTYCCNYQIIKLNNDTTEI